MTTKQDFTSLDGQIAVVGMAGRFPAAKNVEEFWMNIRDGRESITHFTDDDLRRAGVPEDLFSDPNYVKCAPVLEDMDCFDAAFFGISRRDAAIMDPQHRHFLECAWEALEHAGHPPEAFEGRISVFAGAGAQCYLIHNILTHPSLVESLGSFLVHYSGNEKDVLATRVSYQLNLTGPSITIQTACSTSLVAVHLGCQSLLNRECDMALAGGVTIWVPHGTGYLYREGEIRSRDGHCRPFDAESSGTIFGSGVGIVVLRRLTDALRDRDCIYGVIKGSAVNNDGNQKVSYFAPSVPGQANAVAEALAAADVNPESIGYVETHGTGTRIGDPIEIAALSEAFRAYTDKNGFCAIGSIKSNIGHLDTAAGVAGLIKTLQALVHKQLPPSVNFRVSNPEINFFSSPFHVNTALTEWKRGESPRRAGVNSLGIGGTNAHVIVEEAPDREASSPSRPWQILVLSAKTRAGLEKATNNLSSHIADRPELNLADVAYTLTVGRRAFSERRAAVCRSLDDAREILAGRNSGRLFTQRHDGSRKVAFMFTGQGAQYVNMGRQLYESERFFKEQVDRCAEILRFHMEGDIRDLLYPDVNDPMGQTLQDTAVAQAAIFTVEFALASLWRHWGIEPEAMVGHSVGEYVAACVSGVFAFEDALALVALRGRLMQGLPYGSMLAILRPEDEVKTWLSENISLAAVNGPELCVVSGPSDAVDALHARLTSNGILCRPLPVTRAFHSTMMEPILGPFTAELRKIRLQPPRIPFASNVSGDWITAEQATDPAYWGSEHIRRPVRFADCLQQVTGKEKIILLEVGPGTTLTSLARRHPNEASVSAFVSSLPNSGEATTDVQFLLTSLGKLWLAGARVDWGSFYSNESRNRVPLPTYPFEQERFWIDPATEREKRPSSALSKGSAIQDWFYQPSWKRSLPPHVDKSNGTRNGPATVAIFTDGCGVGERIASRMRTLQHRVVSVRAGDTRVERGPDEFVVNPACSADMDWLVEHLFRLGQPPTHIVHLWNLTPNPSRAPSDGSLSLEVARSFYSLLYLAHAVAKRNRTETLHLSIVSNGMQQVGGEPLAHPVKALLLGPCRVIPREITEFTCRSIDVSLPTSPPRDQDELIDLLTAEALNKSDDEVVAYRGGERFVETFEKVRFWSNGNHLSGLRDHGVYLITGGLGGLGLAVAELLVKRVHAKIVLIGRTPPPPSHQWDKWLATHDPLDKTSVQISKIRYLEMLGGSILVLPADVCDATQMRDVVTQAQRRFGSLDGVFHLAGILDDGLIELKSKDAADRVLLPKVQGTLSLLEALQGIPLDFVVLFSSISSLVGVAGQVDYAAANAFLNAFARHRRGLDGTRVVAIDWGMWQEVGMAARRFQQIRIDPVEPRTKAEVQPVPEWLDRVSPSEKQIVEVGVKTHWFLNEHRRKDGLAVMPGTGYIELARAAVVGAGKWTPVEIRDVLFLAPMPVGEGDPRRLRIQIERDQTCARFSIASTSSKVLGEDPNWNLHTTGAIFPVQSATRNTYDLDSVFDRCESRVEISKQPDHEFWSLGPRWASLKEIRFGPQEAVLTLQMPSEFESELNNYPLHPALLDMATGELVTQFSKCNALFVPFSYAGIRAYKPLERILQCHVRYRQPSLENSPIAAFDVTIVNGRGEILVEVEEFLMRRVESQNGDFAGPSSVLHMDERAKRHRSRNDASLSQVFQHGIHPTQGVEALDRILGQAPIPQIIVSPVDLDKLIAASRTTLGANEQVFAAVSKERDRARTSAPSVMSPTDVPGIIRSLWQEALGLEDIRERDDFFNLGGHSLTLVQVVARLRQRFSIDLPLSSLIEQRTVAHWTHEVNAALAAGEKQRA